MDAGWGNAPIEPPGKTVGEIIRSNIFTYFNMLFFLLAACVIAVGAVKEIMFLGVVIANIAIGIVQELRSKKTLDKLTLLTAPKGTVVRDGRERQIPTAEMVRDDVVVFSAGSQIFADAVVIDGECAANEALITGEADEIKKIPGSELLSGSFIVSGECRARLTHVGADSYANRLTLEAKAARPPQQSEIMRSLTRLVQIIGIAVIPLGILMAVKEIAWLGRSVQDGVVATVASLIGMIPEGLYLLTSMALAAGVVRLAQKKTLVHDMGCIETLARVDVLCVDKTGTVTENKMTVEDVALLCPNRFVEDDIRLIMSDYVAAMSADNDTMAALRRYFTGEVKQKAEKALPFSSARKYGGVSFHEDETYLLGAPDILLGRDIVKYQQQIDSYSAKGCRVLLLALYDGSLDDEKPSTDLIMPLALILLSNKIREEAPDTFKYFAGQGVAIKVISGDNAMAVSEVAKRAGISGAEKYVDARTLQSDEDISAAVEEYTVFGRVTPDQKRRFVRALKARGHTVAMTGDGVNDVLALKEADCSIAMASGSDAARTVSSLVLLDSNFASMPVVVQEGRRSINNLQRSSALFLSKTIFSALIAVLFIFINYSYPFQPVQQTLISTLTIGTPSFILALEPNKERLRGKFILNVIRQSIPAALTMTANIVLLCALSEPLGLSNPDMSTLAVILTCLTGFIMLFKVSTPFNGLRGALFGVLLSGFVASLLFLRDFFALTNLTMPMLIALAPMLLFAIVMMLALLHFVDHIIANAQSPLRQLGKRKGRRHKPH